MNYIQPQNTNNMNAEDAMNTTSTSQPRQATPRDGV